MQKEAMGPKSATVLDTSSSSVGELLTPCLWYRSTSVEESVGVFVASYQLTHRPALVLRCLEN